MSEREEELTRVALEAIKAIEDIVGDLRQHIIDDNPEAHEAIRKALDSDGR